MNSIILRGIIRNIQFSHKIGDIEYDKADMICKRYDGKEDIINLRFKKFSNPYKNDQEIELVGNIRSYSKQVSKTKNKVDLYVFTYFDRPEDVFPDDETTLTLTNSFILDGRICKIEPLRTTKAGKQNIHFIVANNLENINTARNLNSYLPCIAWGKLAKDISKLSVNAKVEITGELHSRDYRKQLSEDEFEIRIAHEVSVMGITVVDN